MNIFRKILEFIFIVAIPCAVFALFIWLIGLFPPLIYLAYTFSFIMAVISALMIREEISVFTILSFLFWVIAIFVIVVIYREQF